MRQLQAHDKQEREQAYQDYMLDLMKWYYDTKRDEDGMEEFKRLLELGCFGKEFCIYGFAYEDQEGIAYRVSGKAINLHEFIKYSAISGCYPTPVICNYQRRIAPSGSEDTVKNILKKDTAYLLQQTYNQAYFSAMKRVSSLPANNSGYALLSRMRDYLDGRFVRSELELFEGLLLETFNAKKLTLQSYMEFAIWLKDVRKQMENDILEKTLYEKSFSGFSYVDDYGNIKYFTDAFLQTTYETRENYELKGRVVSPIYVRKYWLKEMGQFVKIKNEFEVHIQECFDEHYWSLLEEIKAMPSAIPTEFFVEQAVLVKENCSDQAYENLLRYGQRWGIEIKRYL